jgi:hypothetical protein
MSSLEKRDITFETSDQSARIVKLRARSPATLPTEALGKSLRLEKQNITKWVIAPQGARERRRRRASRKATHNCADLAFSASVFGHGIM